MVVDGITHIIQVALTPVFLLSSIGTLLNVFSTRLGRVSDRLNTISGQLLAAGPAEMARLTAQLAYLRRRSRLLDGAVVSAALGGGFTCLAALILFIGALRDHAVTSALFSAFGAAIACTMMAIAAFVAEVLLASRGFREEVEAREIEATSQLVSPADRERLERLR